MNEQQIDFGKLNLVRLAHNYLMAQKNGEYTVDDLNTLNNYVGWVLSPDKRNLPKFKVGLVFIAVNPPYWQYAPQVLQDARSLFLPGHDVEYMLFSDIPKGKEVKKFIDSCPSQKEMEEALKKNPEAYKDAPMTVNKEYAEAITKYLEEQTYLTVFPVDAAPWPYPTLMRYHMILGQEEYLKKFDYLFYMDLDMRVVNVVGDEILGNGITAAKHPMYALDKKFTPPYEPNAESAAYIPRPGRVIDDGGKPRFEPLYYAGGFQGGRAGVFIEAMKEVKRIINADLDRNYIPIWNDESAWNAYLFKSPPDVVLSPSYIYPDSLIDTYYKPIWGRNYTPRIVTLTKAFTLSKEGGQAAAKMSEELKPLQ